MNARDLLNRVDGILFEGDAARTWLAQLAKRAKGTLDAAKGNKIVDKECRTERDELIAALRALDGAYEQLEVFAEAVSKRETGK